MKRIAKEEPAPHVVVCDTNILWHEDKGPVVSPDFSRFWSEHTPKFDLSLYIPDTVYGELMFQHFSSCSKLARGVEENLKRLSSYTDKPHKSRITDQNIRTHLEAKFSKWMRSMGATRLELPHSKINWARIANDSVWRVPPFLADPKNPDFEKGFRDTLILETLYDFVTREDRTVNIAFLCNDTVLRNEAARRLKTDARFTTYETIQEFQSYLSLTKERLTNEFIKRILSRASAKFCASDDESCVWKKHQVWKQIREKFTAYFEDPEKSERRTLLSFASTRAVWRKVAPGRFYIPNPEFLRVEGEKTYLWKSIITFVELFYREEVSYAPDKPTDSGQLLVLQFDVVWSAMVKNDARFYDLTLISINMVKNEFRKPTDSEQKMYQLPSTTGS